MLFPSRGVEDEEKPSQKGWVAFFLPCWTQSSFTLLAQELVLRLLVIASQDEKH